MSNWEGLGGPISAKKVSFDDIDPTLDSCCQRELQDNRKYNALQQTLQKYDIVAEKERRRRNLVNTGVFEGCRCCYDPNTDGKEYEALTVLRARRQSLREEANQGYSEEPDEIAEKEEEVSDEESGDEFDYLLDEDLPDQSEEVKQYEARRKFELEMRLLDSEWNLQHGYGAHRQLHPLRVLKAAHLHRPKPNTHAVLHLFDPDSEASASLDLYLESLAKEHPGTKFLRANGRQTLLMDAQLAQAALPSLKHDRDLPCLLAIKGGSVLQYCPRLVGLRDDSSIVEDAVYSWLDQSGVLIKELNQNPCNIRPEEEALMNYLATKKPPEPRFDCGIPGCRKTFHHEHIGFCNEQQQGLVVPEEAVIGTEGSQTWD